MLYRILPAANIEKSTGIVVDGDEQDYYRYWKFLISGNAYVLRLEDTTVDDDDDDDESLVAYRLTDTKGKLIIEGEENFTTREALTDETAKAVMAYLGFEDSYIHKIICR